jgi:ankyrin repeat/BTB/POZ domain-containing protein 1
MNKTFSFYFLAFDRYYACLCGHTELVEYLLESGARCEAQTFDGERILYGALTNEIRNKLRTYKVTTSRLVARDDYEEFLRKYDP